MSESLTEIPAQDGGHIHSAFSSCTCDQGGMLDANGEMRAIEVLCAKCYKNPCACVWDNEFVSDVARSPERPYGKGWYEEKPGIWRREFVQKREKVEEHHD